MYISESLQTPNFRANCKLLVGQLSDQKVPILGQVREHNKKLNYNALTYLRVTRYITKTTIGSFSIQSSFHGRIFLVTIITFVKCLLNPVF